MTDTTPELTGRTDADSTAGSHLPAAGSMLAWLFTLVVANRFVGLAVVPAPVSGGLDALFVPVITLILGVGGLCWDTSWPTTTDRPIIPRSG